MMSFWMGACDAASEAANAMRRQQGMVRQGDMIAPEPLEQIVEALRRSASRLAQYPDTDECVEQLNEIAARWNMGRPNREQFERDLRTTMMIETTLHGRLTEEFRRFRQSQE